jgi:TolA-binding protein
MDSLQKYMLIGPLVLLVALGVAYMVKRQAAKPRDPGAQLHYARTIERRLETSRTKASKDAWLKCIAQYRRVFELWPESDEVVAAYAHIGTIYKKQLKDPEQAKAWYDRVIEEFPNSETAEGLRRERTALALSHPDTEEGWREAVEACSDFIKHNPDSAELDTVLFERGKAYIELKQADEAIADFERILSEFPKSKRADDAVLYIGIVYQALLDDDDKALEQYDKLIADYPDSNQIRVAHKRNEQIWEGRVGRMLDEYFKARYGVRDTTMFFPPVPRLYDIQSGDDEKRANAAQDQMLDLKSADLTVTIDGTTLAVSGSLVIANPSELEPEEQEEREEAEEAKKEAEELSGQAAKKTEEKDKAGTGGEKKEEEDKGPKEAKTVWLHLNEGMELKSLTQGEAKLEFKRYKNLVEVTLAEPIPVDGETTLTFEVSNAEGKPTPGIVIGEQYGHAFAHAFWFPVTKLDDAFPSSMTFRYSNPGLLVSNGSGSPTGTFPGMHFEVSEGVCGRFFVYGPYTMTERAWSVRKMVALTTAGPEGESAVAGVLDEAVKAADFLLGEFGEYPYDKLIIAQSPYVRDTVFEHGAGLILVNDKVRLEALKPEHICNELVQQWYGCVVYPVLDKWIWFTAGVASYYETRYLAQRYGEAAMTAHLAELRDLYAKIFEHIGERAMVYRPDEQSERVFDGLIYTKGAYFMRTLRWAARAEAGTAADDEAFVEAQRAFLEKNAFEPVIFRDLRIRLDKVTGQTFRDVFGQWLMNAGTPAFKVEEWTTAWSGKQIEVGFKLTQESPQKYELPVEIAFEAGEQRVVKTARITKTVVKKEEGKPGKDEEIWHDAFFFTLPFNPERIVLDPNYRILLDPKSERVWTRPESADQPAEELILDLGETPVGPSE